MQAQYFHYDIIETYPLSKLEELKEHRRLKVFYHKGTKCVKCGIEATQLALGEGRGKLHIDVYTDDFYPLTIDHILPKSLGGSDNLDNLQPMCCLCNWSKGNGIIPNSRCNTPKYQENKNKLHHIPNMYIKPLSIEIGMEVYKKTQTVKLLGTVIQIVNNPHTGLLSVITDLKPNSYFHTKDLKIKKHV